MIRPSFRLRFSGRHLAGLYSLERRGRGRYCQAPRYAARRLHDDERLRDRVVSLLRNSSTVGRIICASEGLAWDAYRLAAGLRFRREDGAAVTEALPLFA